MPAPGEDGTGVAVTLAEPDGGDAGALKSEGETADPGEAVEDIHAPARRCARTSALLVSRQ
jgi:hypothetical protein